MSSNTIHMLVTLKHASHALSYSRGSIRACLASSSTAPLGHLIASQTYIQNRIFHLPHSNPQSWSSLSFFHLGEWHHHLFFCWANTLWVIFNFFSPTLMQPSSSFVISISKIDFLISFIAIHMLKPSSFLIWTALLSS